MCILCIHIHVYMCLYALFTHSRIFICTCTCIHVLLHVHGENVYSTLAYENIYSEKIREQSNIQCMYMFMHVCDSHLFQGRVDTRMCGHWLWLKVDLEDRDLSRRQGKTLRLMAGYLLNLEVCES